MNETIGVKGGKNDRRRSLLITKNQKLKLEEYQKQQKEKEIIELEKKVKIQQRITFFKTLPIVTIGQVYNVLTSDKEKEKELALKEAIDRIEKENAFSERETKEIIEALKQRKVFALDDDLLGKLGISREAYNPTSEIDLTIFTELTKEEIPYKVEVLDSDKQQISDETKNSIIKLINIEEQQKLENIPKLTGKEESEILEQQNLGTNEQQKYYDSLTPQNKKRTGIDIARPDPIEEKLDKLKNHKIVDEYEKKLKEVRSELRSVIFEYNLIVDSSDNLYESKEADILLERLNEIIKKIEELKRMIAIPDVDKYDDNYLYTLVEEYILEFKNKKFVDEIKDSPLYIMIAEKLDELDKRKDNLQTKIEDKKTTLELDEEKLEEIKERYNNYEKFNKNLLDFQLEQDKILDEIREKMAKATSVQERVEVQVVGMRRQSRRLLNLLGMQMMIPGARSARGLATMAATYLYFMRNAMRPQTTTRRYKTIKVEDYHKEIEKNIEKLDDVANLLTKTSRQIDATIKEFETQFKEYMNVLPECRQLLYDLEKVKDEIKEKEFELQKIKVAQERNLEKNDAKVKVLTNDTEM